MPLDRSSLYCFAFYYGHVLGSKVSLFQVGPPIIFGSVVLAGNQILNDYLRRLLEDAWIKLIYLVSFQNHYGGMGGGHCKYQISHDWIENKIPFKKSYVLFLCS